MRIYTKVVFDMKTCEVMEEESFDYDGPLAMCGGGGGDTIEAPKPTETELAIQDEQLQSLRKSNKLYDAMLPIALNEYGLKTNTAAYTPEQQTKLDQLNATRAGLLEREAAWTAPKVSSPWGLTAVNPYTSKISAVDRQIGEIQPSVTYSKMTEEDLYNSMTPLEKSQYDASKLQSDRTIKALKGELPISPALEASLSDEEQQTIQYLTEKLGPEYLLSTSGQNALAELRQKQNLIREEARRGEISQGTALMLGQQGYYNTSNAASASNLLGAAQSGLGYTSAYNTALLPYQQQRQAQLQANQANAQLSGNRSAGLMGGIGSIAGLGAGLLLAPATGGTSALLASGALGMGAGNSVGQAFSDSRLKYNVVYL